MPALGFAFNQDQDPKETRVIHLSARTGEAYGIPEVYDLRPIAVPDHPDQRAVMLDRHPSPPVELWRGPAPTARALVHLIIHTIENSASGDVIDVAALAQRIQEGEQ